MMGPHAELNLRWSPIYGKLNLLGELPIHFQAFLTLGGGAGQFQFYSPVFCLQEGTIPDPNDPLNTNPFTETSNPNEIGSPSFQAQNTGAKIPGCVYPLHMTDIKPVGNFGGGLRIFITKNVALKLEVRDYFFPDFYFISIQRSQIGGWNGTGYDTNFPTNNPTPNTVQGYCASSSNCNKASSPGFTSIVLINFGLQWIF
jgi:outer membrane beta-barrel protein